MPEGERPTGRRGLKDGLGLRKLVSMSISEAARHDLYNGLSDLLGPERAETLMTHLPRYDPAEVATKSDLVELKTDLEAGIAGLESSMTIRLDGIDTRLDSVDTLLDRVDTRLAGINTRLDRLFLTLVAGLLVIVAAMAGVVFTTL